MKTLLYITILTLGFGISSYATNTNTVVKLQHTQTTEPTTNTISFIIDENKTENISPVQRIDIVKRVSVDSKTSNEVISQSESN